MLRITRGRESGDTTTLELQGRIVGPWVEVLERECRRLLDQGRDLRLDVAAVSFLGAAGVEMLKGLPAGRLVLLRCTPLIRSLLEGLLPCEDRPSRH